MLKEHLPAISIYRRFSEIFSQQLHLYLTQQVLVIWPNLTTQQDEK